MYDLEWKTDDAFTSVIFMFIFRAAKHERIITKVSRGWA